MKLIDPRFERGQVAEEERMTLYKLHVLLMNDDLWDRVRGVGSETWNGCECVELLVVLTRLRGI